MNKELFNQQKTGKEKMVELNYHFNYWIDEDFWRKEELEAFSDVFFDVKSPNDILEHVLHHIVYYGGKKFIDGVGYVMINGQYPAHAEEVECCRSIKIDYSRPDAFYW